MSRRDARILAVEALYAWDIAKHPVTELARFDWMDDKKREAAGPKDLDFARALVSGAIGNIARIDRVIEKYLRGWELSRLKRTDLAVLRVSAYALLFQKEIHPAVVINEAIELCAEYGAEDSFKFVNAVLDHIKNEPPDTNCRVV